MPNLLLPGAVLALASVAFGQQADGGFVLTREGTAACTIVLADKPSPSAEFAAAELQLHISKITGAQLPIVTETTGVDGRKILVGESPQTRAMGLRSDEFEQQEYLVRATPGTLVLIGRDTPPTGGKPNRSAPSWIEGEFGQALSFDGVDDGLRASECGFEDEVGTMECWVRLSSETQDAEGTILRLDGNAPWTYHILRRVQGTSKVGYFTYDGKQVRGIASRELAPGWHHVAASHDASARRAELFVDGVSQGQSEYVKTTCHGSGLDIGGLKRGGAVSNPLHGDIDEVRISRTVRPVEGVPNKPAVDDEATCFLAHLDEGSGLPRLSTGYPGGLQPPGLFDANGTLYATYDLLERHLGVRWYAPTQVGTVYPARPTLTVPVGELRRKPAMRYRWITPTKLYMPTRDDTLPGTQVDLWKLRMRIGGEDYWACHSFGGYYERFLDTHPEWFAQGYGDKPPQMCYSSEGLVQQVVRDATDYFAGKGPGGRGDYFGVVPQDNSSYCKCARCQAQIDRRDEGNQQFSRGLVSNYVWDFVNRVATATKQSHPDKMIGALAYARYAYYPDKVRLEPNILVQMCLHTRNWWAPYLEKNDMKIFNDWVSKEGGKRPIYLWLYYNFPAMVGTTGRFNCFPGFFVHTAIGQMKMYHEAGIGGIFMEHSSEFGQSFLQDQLDMYVTLKLADDPSLDGEALVDEFFSLYYGAAAEPMKSLYFDIEKTYSDPTNYSPEVQSTDKHYHQTEEMAWRWLGTQERMERFAGLMAQAHDAAATDLEKQRVDLFDRGVWQYMVEGRRQYMTKQAGREKIEALKKEPPPTVSVPRLPATAKGDPRTIDWSAARALAPWRTVEGLTTQRVLSAWVCHDAEHLYAKLQDAVDPAKLTSTKQVYDGDDWELFIAPARSEPYRQVGVAPDGTQFEAGRGESPEQWRLNARVWSDVAAPDRWTTYIAIPLANLLPPGASVTDGLYANLYRATATGDLFAWSPNFTRSFHVTDRMGLLTLDE